MFAMSRRTHHILRFARRATVSRDPRTKLIATLLPLAPDLAAELWSVRDVRELPRGTREAICDVRGFESANRGLNRDESLNAYGNELEALIATLGLDEEVDA